MVGELQMYPDDARVAFSSATDNYRRTSCCAGVIVMTARATVYSCIKQNNQHGSTLFLFVRRRESVDFLLLFHGMFISEVY